MPPSKAAQGLNALRSGELQIHPHRGDHFTHVQLLPRCPAWPACMQATAVAMITCTSTDEDAYHCASVTASATAFAEATAEAHASAVATAVQSCGCMTDAVAVAVASADTYIKLIAEASATATASVCISGARTPAACGLRVSVEKVSLHDHPRVVGAMRCSAGRCEIAVPERWSYTMKWGLPDQRCCADSLSLQWQFILVSTGRLHSHPGPAADSILLLLL